MLAIAPALAAALLISAIAAPSCSAAVITLNTGEWLPYASQQLPYKGAIPRIVRAAFALEGVEVKLVFRPWNRAYREAADGQADGSIIWSSSARDTDRKRDFYFSDALFEGKSVFFHLKSFPFEWRNLDQLHGLTVGGTLGYEYFFDQDPLIKVDRSAATDEQNFVKLLAGRFQLFPSNLDVGLYFLASGQLTRAEAAAISWDPKPYNTTQYHLILNKKNKANRALLAKFNRGLQKLKASGKYQQYMDSMKKPDYAVSTD